MVLTITAAEMITAVGPDRLNSCAAIRAGLVRSQQIPYFSILDNESQEVTPLVGRSIRGLTEGFFVQGLWVRLGAACLDVLVENAGLPGPSATKFWSRTGLLAVTPPIDDGRFDCNGGYTVAKLKEAYLGRLSQVLRFSIATENMDVVPLGHTGTVAALERAATMITEHGLERIVVLSVDSYLDPLTLDWLVEFERLKTPTSPTGLIPGEAAACFVVEACGKVGDKGAAVRALVHEPALGSEENHYFSGERTQGAALAGVILQALATSRNTSTTFSGDVISDVNGEEWRTYEFACARVRLSKQIGSQAHFVLPATTLGEIGCASGAVAICIAMSSFERNYAQQDSVLIASSSDNGGVGAVLVSKA